MIKEYLPQILIGVISSVVSGLTVYYIIEGRRGVTGTRSTKAV